MAGESGSVVSTFPLAAKSGAEDYTLGQIVHSSSRSLLYLATRKSDGASVIIKTIPDEFRASDADRIRNEYAVGLKLNVPGVMQPLELWSYQGRPALVLEFFDGRPLHKEIKPPLATDRFLEIACRITAILAGIHARKVVHKDIKPDNILYSAKTREVRIADFGISSFLNSHRPRRESVWTEGSLPYMSPEQTGRIDRVIDARSDLYSLGITFYELLTGSYPFQADDPLEWAHCHIAKIPQPPRERDRSIPEILSAMVLKLLSKDPEDRYQSAQGLRLDLEECRRQWQLTGAIQAFPLGIRDFSEGLRIPRRLYGRDVEIAVMKGALQRAAEGEGPEIAMVSGYSGVGKSSLVEVLRMNSLAAQGMFVAGKFDQYHRDIPYATLVEAFSAAVLQILAGGEERISDWNARLQAALGVNGRLMLELIPQLESLMEKQPPVPDLSPTEAKNRLRMVFRQFIGVFAQQDHPLVLFLDDMQWADSASLEMIADLAANRELRQLLMVGAYRDNEVGPSHPLAIAMEAVRKSGVVIRSLVLSPLSETQLSSLLNDALRPASGDLSRLTALIKEKTGGNPFFAIQFLLSLNEEGLIHRDATGAWDWNIEAIEAKGFTENVIDLMSERLHRLSPAARETLQHFACLGAKAGVGDMARVLGNAEEDCHDRLSETLAAGLVVSSFDTFAFLHDRVQEAAYSSIGEDQRPEWHLRIGRRLQENRSQEAIEEKVFLIVSQLNRGIKLIRDEREKENLLKLDTLAGRKAKASVAYDTARTCYSYAIELLPMGAWSLRYRECFSLHLELSECEFLLGNFDRAEELALMLLEKADSRSDRAAVYELRMRCHQLSGKFDKALALSMEGLALFGIKWPERDEDILADLGKAMQEVQGLMQDRSVDSILNAPVAEDADVRALISLLVGTIPSTFYIKPILFPLVVLESTIQSLRHGNVEDSCIAYCCYGAIIQEDVETGFRISEMSLRLNEKFGDAKRRSAVLYLHAAPHNYRKRSFASSFPILERGYLCGLETGDLLHASYNAIQHVYQAVESGMPFDQLQQLTARYREFTRQSHNPMVERSLETVDQFVAALQGRTKGATSFDDGAFDEKETLDYFAKVGFIPSVAAHHIRKQMLAVLNGQFEESLAHAALAAGVLLAVRCLPLEATYHFYRALGLAGHYSRAGAERQAEFLRGLEEEQTWLGNAARHCPENFRSRYLLVSAEIARLEGKDLEAMRYFERAVEAAEANVLILDEALIQETASRFFRDKELGHTADQHLGRARSAYRRLGASGKVASIDLHHPRLRTEKGVGRDTAYESHAHQLDILSVAKISQAISGEILLDGLLRKMMAAMLEQAGAQWGCLLLRNQDKYILAAEADLAENGSVTVVLTPADADPKAVARPLPQSILAFAARSKKRLIMENAVMDATFSVDPYIVRARPKSVLCMPILRQGEPSGLLYLENNLLAGVFTADKLEILELIASQAAISLENARLYEGLRREYSERKQVEEQLRHSQKMDALGTLAAGIAHDFNNLLTAIIGYSEMALINLNGEDRLFGSLREILKSGERAAGLTRQLLAYSRKQVLSPKLWNLNEIVKEMESLLERLIGESVTVDAILGINVGHVRADRGQVEQILMNLVVNARDAMPRGGMLTVETANVELGPDFCSGHPGMVPGPYVMMAVRDNGTGMTPEVQAKLFEPFFTTKEVGKGTGLGLAVVYGIVHQSGGGIAVQSLLGQGTTFRIYLPRADSAPDEQDDAILPGPDRKSMGGETILLVEDEESVRKFTAQALESQGYQVLVFARAREALLALDGPSLEIHLVISDIVMPDMGGKELAERIRKLRPKLPILFISGYADQPEGHDPIRGEGLLQKPFGLSEILKRVRQILRMRL
ncbi:MAG: Signal transduction histidine kinase CheA [Fibrobacteres bacterium]|nr:Signal transduction histidine kinase CheA [Fibrobacterota bacterium]